MRDKWLNVVIALLVIVALGLGYFIYTSTQKDERGNFSTNLSGNLNLQTNTQNTDSSGPTSPDQGPSSQVELGFLTPEEMAIFQEFPEPGASEEVKLAFNSKLNNMAVDYDTEVLDVSNCDAFPFVYRVKRDEKFKIKNSDNVERTIETNSSHQTVVPASGEIEVTVSDAVGEDIGNYGYLCDGRGPLGIIVVVEK